LPSLVNAAGYELSFGNIAGHDGDQT